MSLTIHAGPMRTVAAVCGATVLLLGVAACGSNDSNGATGQTGEQGGPQNRQQGSRNGTFPGANGKVAAVADRTAQVQGMNGQVAVTWTRSTTFTKEVGAALSDVKVGDCVMVGSTDQPSSGSSSSTSVTAATVRITARTNGSCTPVMRGPGGQGGTGPQTYGGPPPGSGGSPRPQMRMGGAFGEVTAVSATGFTVDSVVPGGGTSTNTSSVTVSVGASTTYTTTAKGAASDVKIGVCVAATGTADQTGAVTATSIAVSQPQGGQCGGFARFSSDGGGPSTQGS